MSYRFDSVLYQINADALKPMAHHWGGASNMRKDDCIAFIRSSLANPAKVREVIARLEPWEWNALAFIKQMGNAIDQQALEVGLSAAGTPAPQKQYYKENGINALLRKGLALADNSYYPTEASYSYGDRDILIFSDDRLLEHIGLPEIRPLEISPTPRQGETISRLPSTIVLDIVSILQAIDKMGGLQLTQAGEVRANDRHKIEKLMHWKDEGVEIDGLLFPDPVTAWANAFRHSDLLVQVDNNRLVLKETPATFAARPYEEQIRLILNGFLRSGIWSETPSRYHFYDYHGKKRQQGRFGLVLALSALPLDTRAFFSMGNFDQALYNRIGEGFSIGYAPKRPYTSYSDSRQKQEQALAEWQASLRANWLKVERPWFEGAFKTWLYFLGLVELAVSDGAVTGFGLTEIGRAVLHPELQDLAEDVENQSPDGPAWIVQPNFDVVAYLDNASAPQLAFLERHAERRQTHQHTAHYRLTRESVYQGLESGTTLAELLEGLQAGAHNDLPQNVLVELREWAALRERMVLRRSASVLEFPDAQALQDALAKGMAGRVVGDRVLLLDKDVKKQAQPAGKGFVRIDYARPLPKNLTVHEDGKIDLKREASDIIIRAQVNQWAVPLSDLEWQLTAESVSAQLKSGRKIKDLIELLKERTSRPIPALLEIALRSWAGEACPVELAAVVALHVPQETLFQAILASQRMRPYLKGSLPPNLIFIDPNQVEAFRSQLNWLGCAISDQLRIIPLEKKVI